MGTSTHAEGRPKLAVGADGSLVAAFEVPRPTANAPHAGDFLFARSTDGGRTWSAPRPRPPRHALATEQGLLLAYVRTGEGDSSLVLRRLDPATAPVSHRAPANR